MFSSYPDVWPVPTCSTYTRSQHGRGGWVHYTHAAMFNSKYRPTTHRLAMIHKRDQPTTNQRRHNMVYHIMHLYLHVSEGHKNKREICSFKTQWVISLTDTDLCPCGETQTMFHIVKYCPLTKLNGGLSRLHSADEDAVSWLTSYGYWHAYEKKKISLFKLVFRWDQRLETKWLNFSLSPELRLTNHSITAHHIMSSLTLLLISAYFFVHLWISEKVIFVHLNIIS